MFLSLLAVDDWDAIYVSANVLYEFCMNLIC